MFKPVKSEIKESTIIIIALVVGLFINSHRIAQIIGFAAIENAEFLPVTFPDLSMRFLSLSFFSWVILKFNLDWGDKWFKIPLSSNANKIVKRFIFLIISILISIILYLGFNPLYTLIFELEIPEPERAALVFGWAIVLVALLLVSFILKLQLKSKNEAIEKEQLKREKEQLKQEKIKSELVAIKNQVNPHFLFNSLNTLNSVIRHNPKNATDFVDKLSFMYRYILQSSEKGLVPLTEELEFLNSYVYLINIRYGNRFELKNTLDLDTDTIEIPVLSLQLLVENAVKHNKISEDSPLMVKIYNDREYIVVENKIEPRNSLQESTGNGLINLSKRYEILKNRDIKIYKASSFIVKLPFK